MNQAKFKKKITLITFFLQTIFLHAANISVTFPDAEIKKDSSGRDIPTVYVNQDFRVRIVVTGVSAEGMKVEGLDKLSVVSNRRHTNLVLGQNVQQQDTVIDYDVVAGEPGVFKLGPAKILTKDGKDFSSGVFYYQVLEQALANKNAPQAKRKQINHRNMYTGPSSYTARSSNKYLVHCQLATNRESVVVGESFEVSLLMYLHGPISQIAVQPPDFKGFSVKVINDIPPREEKLQGEVVEVREQRYILTPLQAGVYNIPPAGISYIVSRRNSQHDLFSAFFGGVFGEQKNTESNAISIKVNGLPPYSGRIDGIGEFNIFQGFVDKQEAVINEPIKLTFFLEGKGNFDYTDDLKLVLPHSYRFYKSKTEIQENLQKGFTGGRKIFEFVVQIPSPGKHTIAPQAFVYYDTNEKKYKKIISQEIAINILPDPSQSGSALLNNRDDAKNTSEVFQEKKQGNVQGEDICFIEENVFFNQKMPLSIPWWGIFFLMLAPLLSIKDFGVLFTRIRFFKKNNDKFRTNQALKELNKLLKENNSSALYQFFLRLCNELFAIGLHEVVDTELEKKLLENGWSLDKIEDFLTYLSACAGIHFVARDNNQEEESLVLKKAHYWFILLTQKKLQNTKKIE